MFFDNPQGGDQEEYQDPTSQSTTDDTGTTGSAGGVAEEEADYEDIGGDVSMDFEDEEEDTSEE